MPVSDQGVNLDRYMLIPRTAIFVRLDNAITFNWGAASPVPAIRAAAATKVQSSR